MVDFKERSIGRTGKRKVLDEDDPEEEQVEEENHPTSAVPHENSDLPLPALQISLTDQAHDMILQMFSKSAMMAEHDALQQKNPDIEDDTVTTPSSIVASTIALLNKYHTLKEKATSQPQGDWSDSSVSMALTSIRMAAQLIPDLLKSAAIMTSAHMALSFEACVATRQIYWWYACTGPDLASTLFGFYHQNREAQVFKTYPSLATLVDAIMTYVTATSERSSKKRKTTNGSNMPSLEDL